MTATDALQHEVERTSALCEISAVLLSRLDQAELCHHVVDEMVRRVQCEGCTLFVVDGESGALAPAAVRGELADLAPQVPFGNGAGLSGWVMKQRRAVFLPEIRTEQPMARIKSLLAVPLVVDEEPVGVLSLAHSRPGALTRAHADLAEGAAALLGAAIRQGRRYRELEERATRDPLTGLYNRSVLEEALDREASASRRHDADLAVLMIDMDRFKAVNDAYGHPAGDVVLREAASLIAGSVRNEDVAARYGGEEFAVLLPRTAERDAAVLAGRIRDTVAAHRFRTPAGTITLTLSIGLASRGAGVPAGQLVAAADRALYAAKERGGNSVCRWRVRATGAGGRSRPEQRRFPRLAAAWPLAWRNAETADPAFVRATSFDLGPGGVGFHTQSLPPRRGLALLRFDEKHVPGTPDERTAVCRVSWADPGRAGKGRIGAAFVYVPERVKDALGTLAEAS